MEIQSIEEVRIGSGERVGVALAPKSNAQLLLDWSLQHGAGELFLVYVRPRIRTIPTPMGKIPVAQVSKEKLESYMVIRESTTQEYCRELQKLCEDRQVNGNFVVVDSDEVGKALVEQIKRFVFTKFILGASKKGLKLKLGTSDYVLKHAPKSCRVQCVSRSSKLLATSREPRRGRYEDKKADFSSEIVSFPSGAETQALFVHSASERSEPDNPRITTARSELDSFRTTTTTTTVEPEDPIEESPSSDLSSEVSSTIGDEAVGDDAAETAMLKHQLQQAILSNERAKEFAKREIARTQETCQWAVQTVELLRAEEQKKREAATMALEMANKKLEEETQKHAQAALLAETRKTALEEEIHKRRVIEESLTRSRAVRYQQFKYEELQVMTDDFSRGRKLGEGSFYKGSLHHTDVAVKMVKRDRWQGPEEIETLTRLNHPHIALLLGGNSERGCLVYEYLENGSLQDHLINRGDQALPIPCFKRYAMAVQVATAILYLHRANPIRVVVHGHLKLSNILLDRNLNSKVGDLTLPTSERGKMPMSQEELAYLDPASREGGSEQLSLTPGCDVYAFGIILLQLLTALTPIGIVGKVSRAVDHGSLKEILDCTAGEWALEAAMQLACIGLSCTENQKENKIELESVLPMLKELQKFSITQVKEPLQSSHDHPIPPAMFLCPILQEVMEYPVLAADGHTYEYEAIRRWLEKNRTSPMTNLPLETKLLTANRLVRSAICEWKLSQAKNLEL